MGYHLQRTQTVANLERRAAAAERALFKLRKKRLDVIEKRNRLSDQSQILKRQEEAAQLKLATLQLSITGLTTALAYKAQRIKELTGVDHDADGVHGLAPAPTQPIVRGTCMPSNQAEIVSTWFSQSAQVVATAVDHPADLGDPTVGRLQQDQAAL